MIMTGAGVWQSQCAAAAAPWTTFWVARVLDSCPSPIAPYSLLPAYCNSCSSWHCWENTCDASVIPTLHSTLIHWPSRFSSHISHFICRPISGSTSWGLVYIQKKKSNKISIITEEYMFYKLLSVKWFNNITFVSHFLTIHLWVFTMAIFFS